MSKLLLLAFNSAMLSRVIILLNLVWPISYLQTSSSLAVSLAISPPAEENEGDEAAAGEGSDVCSMPAHSI